MSITRDGMKYIVRVEERILTEIKDENSYCHVVAKKNGLVKNIKSSSGEIISRVNDYVRAGDVLISGEIHLYEEVKGNVCASGSVYAEVWYDVNLSIPFEYQEKEYTGNTRYNFILNNKKLFSDKYEFYDEEEINKLKVWGNNFKYIKELEYKNILKKYSVDEALEEAMRKIDENFKIKLKNEGEIVSKKILKKNEFNSRIDIEVFVVTLENIALQQNYSIEGDIIDSE